MQGSVAPIPSMILTPVARWKSSHTAAGRCSPADTQRRRPFSAPVFPVASSARYMVGAVNSVVTPCSAIASASSPGVARSSNRTLAPTLNGNTIRPPSPKVNPSGGVPAKTSSRVAASTCRPNVSQMAMTSRWKCMVALGLPVVPEVAASRATSSAAVATAWKLPLRAAQRLARSSPAPSGDPVPPYSTVGSAGSAAASSPAKR